MLHLQFATLQFETNHFTVQISRWTIEGRKTIILNFQSIFFYKKITKQTKKHYKSLEFQTIITKDMVKSFSWFIPLNHMFSRLKESGISKTQKIAVTHTHTQFFSPILILRDKANN